MKRIARITLTALLLGSCTTSSVEPALPWVPFRWQSAEFAGRQFPHAALMVPFSVDGLAGEYELQLDLGTGWPVLNGVPFAQALRHASMPVPSGETARISGRIGPYELREHEFRLREGGGSALAEPTRGKLGSLGLNFFRHRTLVIDFPGQRFAILEEAALPPALERSASWVPARYFNGHVYVPVQIGDRHYDKFFFDTGASIFPLVTSEETWKVLTGRAGTEPDVTVLTVPSWDRQVTLRGARTVDPVQIGPIAVARPEIFYLAEGPDDLKPQKWNPPIDGMIGNTLFLNSIVIVDLPRNRFGVMQRNG